MVVAQAAGISLKKREGLSSGTLPALSPALSPDMSPVLCAGMSGGLCRQAASGAHVEPPVQPARSSAQPIEPSAPTDIARVLLLLHARTNHDFSQYKRSMILRGIHARMAQSGIENTSAYACFCEDTPEEPLLLFDALLIHVTRFFRDPKAFALLKKHVLPQLLRDQPPGRTFRAWVPGCASGEEACSLAITLQETAEELQRADGRQRTAESQQTSAFQQAFAFQVFGTDIDARVLATAFAGIFPPGLARDLTATRRQRFFTLCPEGYRLAACIRETLVFAQQDVVAPQLAGQIDLISCRNLLIYFEPALQDALISAFHRALRPGGVLFLSPSESIGSGTDLFTPISRKWKLYRANTLGPVAATCQPGIAQA